jgi:transcriptional regulator with XRE-family HTH domain
MAKSKAAERESIAFIIGERIRHVRVQSGLSQKELGEKINKSRVTISTLENGKREHINPDLLTEIAQALNQPIAYFYADLYSDSDILMSSREMNDNSPLTSVFSRLSSLPLDKQMRFAEMIDIVLDFAFPG